MNTQTITAISFGLLLSLSTFAAACGGPMSEEEIVAEEQALQRASSSLGVTRDDLEGWGYTCEVVSIGLIRCTKCITTSDGGSRCWKYDCPWDRHAECIDRSESTGTSGGYTRPALDGALRISGG